MGQAKEESGERRVSREEERKVESMLLRLRLMMVELCGGGVTGVDERLKERRWWSESGKGELEKSERVH